MQMPTFIRMGSRMMGGISPGFSLKALDGGEVAEGQSSRSRLHFSARSSRRRPAWDCGCHRTGACGFTLTRALSCKP